MSDLQTVYIVDDDYAVCRALEVLLTQRGGRVQTFNSPRLLLDDLTPAARGCVIVDWYMPEMNGVEVQEELERRGIGLPVIVVSGRVDVPRAVEAMERGAVTLLEKPISQVRLLRAVRRALEIDADRWRNQLLRAEWRRRLRTLTEEELEVMQRMLAGRSAREIATELVISPRTCDRRRSSVLSKLQVGSVPELALTVGSLGLLSKGESGDSAELNGWMSHLALDSWG